MDTEKMQEKCNYWPIFRPLWVRHVLVGSRFWPLWGGHIVSYLIIVAIVALPSHLLQNGMREFVDTNVQNGLVRKLADPDLQPGRCSDDSSQAMANCIAVVGIDAAEYLQIFHQQSPLDPDTLVHLFDALLRAPPRVVGIDLDLSPASEQDWPARERLLKSLQALAKVTRLVMVCPQGFSTPEPGPLDRAWVGRFGAEVQFASAELGADGLYFNKNMALPTLGVRMAEAAAEGLPHGEKSQHAEETLQHAPKHAGAVDWDAACMANVPADARSNVAANNELIRPAPVLSSSFTQTVAQPQTLANKVVLVGGKWGINDQFKLRGSNDGWYGVNLHAWVVATELAPPKDMHESAKLVMELIIGMLAGGLFALVWKGVVLHRKHFALRSLFYVSFFLVALCLPALWVTLAVSMAKIGLVLGAAGMVLSAAADSFLSSHERIFEALDDEREKEEAAEKQHLVASLADSPAHAAAAKALGPSHATPLEIGLSGLLLFAALLLWGDLWWACLLGGAAAGALVGRHDRRTKADRAKKGASEEKAEQVPRASNAMCESNADLVARLLWLAIRVLALVWLLLSDHSGTVACLVSGFLLSWWLSQTRKEGRVAAIGA